MIQLRVQRNAKTGITQNEVNEEHSKFDKIISMSLKGTLLHSKRRKSVVSSKTQNDGQFGEIGFRKINKQKTRHAVTGFTSSY